MNAQTRRSFLKTAGLGLLSVFNTAFAEPAQSGKPNIVLIIADDLNWTDLGCYGSPNGLTPNIDRLAKTGLKFNNCSTAAAMCVPSRHQLYTGLYPVRTGGYANHSACKRDTRSLPHYLKPLGYRVGLTGKYHVKPASCFPFERVKGFPVKSVRKSTDHTVETGVKEFMSRDPKQPFCLVIGSTHPHAPWREGNHSLYKEEELKLSPVMADTPKMRKAYAHYLAEVSLLDQQVGEIMELIDRLKLHDNTMLVFVGEQGSAFPGAKWTAYELGLKAGCIVRWPRRTKPGSETNAIIQYPDFTPTFVDVAGGRPIDGLDGRSFLKVLTGATSTHRQYAFGCHTNVPEGPPYSIRTIRDSRYKYIMNLHADTPYFEKHMMGLDNNEFWASWEEDARNNSRTEAIVRRFVQRPREEFYDLQNDPWEQNNLAANPEFQGVMGQMKMELKKWMQQQGDQGAAMDVDRKNLSSHKVYLQYKKALRSNPDNWIENLDTSSVKGERKPWK